MAQKILQVYWKKVFFLLFRRKLSVTFISIHFVWTRVSNLAGKNVLSEKQLKRLELLSSGENSKKICVSPSSSSAMENIASRKTKGRAYDTHEKKRYDDDFTSFVLRCLAIKLDECGDCHVDVVIVRTLRHLNI